MGPLIAIVAVAPAAVAAQAKADPVALWHPLIVEASARFGIPVDWIYRVMRAESGGHALLRGRPITSPKGAMGLMQVMPATYADIARRYALGPDPHLPRDNILAGTAYLRLMYDRFGYPGLFAAYNAGPERYAALLRSGKRLPEETRLYLARIAGDTPPGVPAPAFTAPVAPRATLFFPLNRAPGQGDSTSISAPAGGLFVPLQGRSVPPK